MMRTVKTENLAQSFQSCEICDQSWTYLQKQDVKDLELVDSLKFVLIDVVFFSALVTLVTKPNLGYEDRNRFSRSP